MVILPLLSSRMVSLDAYEQHSVSSSSKSNGENTLVSLQREGPGGHNNHPCISRGSSHELGRPIVGGQLW